MRGLSSCLDCLSGDRRLYAGGQSAKPVPADQLEQFKAAVNVTAMQCKEDTTIFGEASEKYRQLAEQAAENTEDDGTGAGRRLSPTACMPRI